jgi:hypothetical protein
MDCSFPLPEKEEDIQMAKPVEFTCLAFWPQIGNGLRESNHTR